MTREMKFSHNFEGAITFESNLCNMLQYLENLNGKPFMAKQNAYVMSMIDKVVSLFEHQIG